MGRRAQRAHEAKHRADRDFLAHVRMANVETLARMQRHYVHAKLWKRIAIQRALMRHWNRA